MLRSARCASPLAVFLLGLSIAACNPGNITGAEDPDAGVGGGPDSPQVKVLSITPAAATLTLKSRTPGTQAFTALLDGAPAASGISFSLDSYNQGDIAQSGVFTSSALSGGVITVYASYGRQQVSAKLTVVVDLSEDVKQTPNDPAPSAGNRGALDGPKTAEASPSKVLYPYDQTVMPLGLTSPVVQLSPGSVPPEDLKVTLSGPNFTWSGYSHVPDAAHPRLSVPQDIWDGAMQSAREKTLQVAVAKATAGKGYGPATIRINVAPALLKGAVYYMTYETPNNGLYSVKPGVRAPAKLLIPGCVVCHSVSSNGKRLATGADQASFQAQSGIYNVGADGGAAQLTGSPAGLGGDSRGISFATFTPDGGYVMRSQNNFWGGINQLAFRIDDVGKKLVPAKVVGLGAAVSALVPTISHDSKRYAFTNGPGANMAFGTVSRSVSLMDLNIDAASDTLTFSNRRLLLDNGAGGAVTKFLTFLPDPQYLLLQEGEGYQASYDEMLPTWDANSTYTGSTGRLYMLNAATKEHLELATLNAGNVAIDRQRNYEPFALPIAAGGYYWVVFTSIREYGNTYQGADVRKQLWVAAISANMQAGKDPSHPPFFLPNQSNTKNERGSWALSPCKSDGLTCDTGDECCGGFCRPSDPSVPRSPKICKPKEGGQCSQIAEKCSTAADCCDPTARCIAGFCTVVVG